MNLAKLFGIGRKAQEPGQKSQDGQLMDINLVPRFIKDAHSCLNDQDGPKFVDGIKIAFGPMKQRVVDQTGKNVGFGDTVHQYAFLTREAPEVPLRAFLELASRLGHASACGVRFLAGELILAYISVGAYRHGNFAEVMMASLELSAESSEVLKASSKYGRDKA